MPCRFDFPTWFSQGPPPLARSGLSQAITTPFNGNSITRLAEHPTAHGTIFVSDCYYDQEGPSWPGRRVSPPRFSHFQDMAGHTTVSAQNVPGHKDNFSVCTFESTEAPLFPGQMFPVRTFCVLGGWPVKTALLDKPFSQFFIPGYE